MKKFLLSATACMALASGSAVAGQSNGSIDLSLNIVAACSVTAPDVNMGELGLMKVNTDVVQTLNVKCTDTTPYTVTLQDPANPTSDDFKLKNGADTIDLQAFSDVGRTTAMNTTAGKSGTSNGAVAGQSVSVYWRVPAQAAKPAGAWSLPGMSAVVTF